MDILDDMGVSKLSAKVFFLKVNYSFINYAFKVNVDLNHIFILLYMSLVNHPFMNMGSVESGKGSSFVETLKEEKSCLMLFLFVMSYLSIHRMNPWHHAPCYLEIILQLLVLQTDRLLVVERYA